MKETATVQVGSEHVVWAFDPAVRPVAQMKSGQTVLFRARDCYDRQIQEAGTLRSMIDGSRINPATGPVEVIGAEPGQCLAVEILALEPESKGFMPLSPGLGVLGLQVTGESTLVLEIADGYVRLPGGIEAPLSPLVGVIGVAPAAGPVRTIFPGDHGGNMDLREMDPGTTVYLPVFAPGGGLCLGDIHGRSGDGELGGNGIETGGACLCRVTVVEGLPLGEGLPRGEGRGGRGSGVGVWPVRRPVLHRGDRLHFVASAEEMNDAIETAMRDAVDFVMAARRVPFEIAYRAVSVLGDIRIAQVVNGLVTVKLILDRRELG